MKSLAIIPARGGSKRLPKKNLRLLGGKPLVCRTLDTAEASDCFDKIILSSDDQEILELAKPYRRIVPEVRSDALSGDKVTALSLVSEIVDRLGADKEFDVVALLLPTAPFRQVADIRAGFDLLDDTVDGVNSLTSYEFPPQLSVTLKDGMISPTFEPCPLITGNTRSQDQLPIYRPNGAFYISWMESFCKYRNFWKGNVKGYIMQRIHSVDIDTEMDLNYAQFLLDNEKF